MQIKKEQYIKAIRAGQTYSNYIVHLEKLVQQRTTTGQQTSKEMVEYTALNLRRMARILKTIAIDTELTDFISKIDGNWHWLVLSEGWCGDAAQHLPQIAKLLHGFPQHQLHIVSRDEHPEVMNAHLTNGGKSIPKLLLMNSTYTLMGDWGPRPEAAQQLLRSHKKKLNESHEEFQRQLQLWYAKDKGKTFQRELLSMLNKAAKTTTQ
jgi:hypothetical protein